jgi:hypothetical protein
MAEPLHEHVFLHFGARKFGKHLCNVCIVAGASWLVHFCDAKSAVDTLVSTRRIETQRLQVWSWWFLNRGIMVTAGEAFFLL